MSFYLKYRPQKASDLDLEVVRNFFERIISSGKASHAYLFTGPKGTGKTSAARILAKILNCEKKKKGEEPCNRCLSCKSIANGTSVDLIEIDAASNRGIDDIRSLREKIGLSPVSSEKKVYIIDEVHMLTTEAFNALLKTLEEPPEHAMFVLATTESHKVPETIKSRCVRLKFPNAGEKEVVRSLKKAVRGEKLNVDKEALFEIAGAVGGSFREGMKILEQLALSKRKITKEKVLSEIGMSGVGGVDKFLEFVVLRDGKKALEEIDKMKKEGVNWKMVIVSCLEELRKRLVDGVGSGDDVAEIVLLSRLFMRAGEELKMTDSPELALELLVAEYCVQDTQESRIKNQELRMPKKPKKKEIAEKKPEQKIRQVDVKLGELEKKWGEVLLGVRPENHSLEGLLRSTRPVSIVGDRAKIEVFYQFHLDQLKQMKHLQIVSAVVARVYSKPLKLEYYLGKRPAAKEVKEVENISGGVEDDDIVRVAEEVFGVE